MEIQEEKNKGRNPFLWIDIIVCLIQFMIGFIFCLFMVSPLYLFMHLYYMDKLGSFWMFTKWDFYLLLVSNIIFWFKIHTDNNSLKK